MISEGSCSIFNEGNVFYNPVQQFNRDLSVSVLSTYSFLTNKLGPGNKRFDLSGLGSSIPEEFDTFLASQQGVKNDNGIDILEALSATGLRSIRYAKEIPGLREIIANDLSREAVASIVKNVEHNGVTQLVKPNLGDAIQVMYNREKRFQVIDLDPYGSPARFLDSAGTY